jgi:hypothetical protein
MQYTNGNGKKQENISHVSKGAALQTRREMGMGDSGGRDRVNPCFPKA